MNHRKDRLPFEEIKNIAMEKLNANQHSLSFYSWPFNFPNTAGPRSGPDVISGQAFTEFQIYGFVNTNTQQYIKYCSGVWKEWDGQPSGAW